MNGWKVELEKLRDENERLHAEANINMVEICRLREKVGKIRALIIKKAGKKVEGMYWENLRVNREAEKNAETAKAVS